MIPQLSLHILEGLTPDEHIVKIVEEEIERLDFKEECDLVGISCMTANAPRAYHIAEEFRKRGRKVVLGGVHPTLLPDEALLHADSVVVGEAEGVWGNLLVDHQNGNLQRKYHQPAPSLDNYVHMQYRKFTKKRLFNIIPILTTRGCPYNCEFCCVSDLYGKKIRHIPIANIVRDIEESGHKLFIFLDDNIIGDPHYAKALFKAVKPLKIKWVGQASMSFVNDTHLMRLARESGCAGLFFGVESVSETQLGKMQKSIKIIKHIDEAIQKVKDIGIFFHASFVFGFDGDTKAVFPETLEFINRNNVGTASFNILTPYPGTRIYEQFKSEGRLLTADWKYYDHSSVVFKPKNMTPTELQEGKIWVVKEFSKISSIIKRFPSNIAHPFIYLLMNIGIKQSVREDIANLARLKKEVFN